MKTIVFKNDGLIPMEAVTTLGVSAKEGENPIGFFGTGLKYSIAIWLRTGHEVKIMRGEDEFVFGLRDTEIRGKPFRLVTMNGADLGFTHELGKNWEPWMAFREMYCNAIDEGGDVEINPLPKPAADITQVIVKGPEVEEIFHKRSAIVLREEPLIQTAELNVHNGETMAVYYRGIAAASPQKSNLYTYNILSHCTLTEDRTIKHDWEWRDPVRLAIWRMKDVEVLENILTAGKLYNEGGFGFDDLHAYEPSQEFLDTVERLERENPMACNRSAVAAWKRRTGRDVDYQERELTAAEALDFAKAISIARRAGARPENYTISVVESLGPGVLGMAKRNPDKIYITHKAVSMGVTMLAGTIFEEWMHLARNVDDCTREFQNLTIDFLMRAAQQLPEVANQEEIPF